MSDKRQDPPPLPGQNLVDPTPGLAGGPQPAPPGIGGDLPFPEPPPVTPPDPGPDEPSP